MSLVRWSVALGLAGLCISAYLTLAHFAQGEVPLACIAGGPINCEQVTTSAESMVGPLPVAFLGVVWFAVLLGLIGPARAWLPSPVLLRLAWTAAGVAVVFYLVLLGVLWMFRAQLRERPGLGFLIAALGYAAIRFVLTFLRQETVIVLGLQEAQVIAVLTGLLALGLLAWRHFGLGRRLRSLPAV